MDSNQIYIEVGVGLDEAALKEILGRDDGSLMREVAQSDAKSRHVVRPDVMAVYLMDVEIDTSDPDEVIVTVNYNYTWERAGGCSDARSGNQYSTFYATYENELLVIEGTEERSTVDEY